MTAEIAIVNRSGIAIAADSALTIGRKRVWKSANKLFSLGPKHDLAVMFWGSGDFFGCPWEIIVKEFRIHCNDVVFDSAKQCADEFLSYISEDKWKDNEAAKISSAYLIAHCLSAIKEDLTYNGAMDFRKKLSHAVIAEAKELIDKDIINDDIKFSDFYEENSEVIQKFSTEIFENYITKKLLKDISRYVFEFFRRKECLSGYETGVVFLGYGKQDIYPVVDEIILDGSICDGIRFWKNRTLDLNSSSAKGAIIPFAQSDMTSLFMEGISESYINFFFSVAGGLLEKKDQYFIKNYVPTSQTVVEQKLREKENEDLLHELLQAFNALKRHSVVNPMIESIHALPRDEMAAMAEALIELTSIRRKVDSHLDSVGGPVDVAVISKGEGFIWIKRKLYFSSDLNADYKYRRERLLEIGGG